MHRLKLIGLAALFSCGGTQSVPVTPAIKADVSAAVSALVPAENALNGAFQVKQAGSELLAVIADARLDLVQQILSQGFLPQGLFPVTSATVPEMLIGTSLVPTGCLALDSSQPSGVLFAAAGTEGCTSSDHLEVTYPNGDSLNLTWSGSGSAFRLGIAVTAGAWKGTSINTQFSPGSIAGSVRYQPIQPVSQVIDADLAWTYSATARTSQVDGHSVDHLGGTNLTASVANGNTSATGTINLSTVGQIEVGLLESPGSAQTSIVTFSQLDVSETFKVASGFALPAGSSTQGQVLWNGTRAGSFVIQQNLGIAFDDGTTDFGSGEPALLTLNAPPY